MWRWGEFAGVKYFGGLSALPVICPYRAEQATGLAGGYDFFPNKGVKLGKMKYFICILLAYLISSLSPSALLAKTKHKDLRKEGAGNLVMCMLAKIFLMLVFVSIFTLISVAAKQKVWLALCGSLGGGMLLFMMVSMITPLGSTAINVLLCAAGGLLFAFGLGAISIAILQKTSLV